MALDFGKIEFNRDVCGNLEDALSREWMETNGIGGFASSTIPGVNTRRYHGLLTAALNPPVGRHVLLSKLEETVFLDGAKYDLSANIYPGSVYPEGYEHLKAFRLDPFPIFTYDVAGLEIEKRVFMVHGENTTVVEYEVIGEGRCTLEIRPLIAFRDYHSTTHANSALNPEVEEAAGEVSIQPYGGLPRLYFNHNATWKEAGGNWYYNFEYPREQERGLDYREDLFQPFMLQFEIGRGTKAVIVASTIPHNVSIADSARTSEIARRAALADNLSPAIPPGLAVAADQFIVRRSADLHTIIAGYHWFADWGRDTMISLPGLTLATGRYDVARDILLAFSRAADRGMLPNRFPDEGEDPEYNTVDASLWFFETIGKFIAYTGDYGFVRANLYSTMTSIIDWHLQGTRYGIHCGADGLISGGDPHTQLTWMDAKIGEFVATPRNGKPVEIQALWYNALRLTASLAARFGDTAAEKQANAIAPVTLESFQTQFWNESAGCLYDVVRDNDRDGSIRPNQVIALSLGSTMVPADRAKSILNVVERELLTPYGLRTLSPSDPAYCHHCNGSQVDRDSAYHQGTIWPWLMGPFITAHVRAYGLTDKALSLLSAFEDHWRQAGIGSISEIMDADAPFAPRGCVAQAWSVAEMIRVLSEDLASGFRARSAGR